MKCGCTSALKSQSRAGAAGVTGVANEVQHAQQAGTETSSYRRQCWPAVEAYQSKGSVGLLLKDQLHPSGSELQLC